MKLLDNDQAYKRFGAFIRAARERKGYTQAEVADLLGMSKSYYAYMEAGSRKATLPVALNICSLLDADINDFINVSTRKKAGVIQRTEI
jgi:transcriptional regulator with XRE-family HTH domain